MRGDRALARASNLLGYKEYTQIGTNSNQITNNSIKYTLLTIYAHTKLMRGWVPTIFTCAINSIILKLY